jgi:hypothetical protein
MNFLSDPKLLNYLILILYLLNTVNWMVRGNLGQFLYWLGCSILTIAVTFLINE